VTSIDCTDRDNIPLIALEKQLRFMIEASKKEPPYLLEPQFYYDHFSVVFIKTLKPDGIKPFEEVKEEIKRILHNERLDAMKKKLLKPYNR
jgi:hypothetical protein